jgi:hypothetical protein
VSQAAGGTGGDLGGTGSVQSLRTRASNCALLTIAVICVCVLVVCGGVIVRAYALAAAHRPTSCVVQNVTCAANVSCTYCAAGTKGRRKEKSGCLQTQFPCLEIRVKYGKKETKAKMHPDSIQATGAFKQVRALNQYGAISRKASHTHFVLPGLSCIAVCNILQPLD